MGTEHFSRGAVATILMLDCPLTCCGAATVRLARRETIHPRDCFAGSDAGFGIGWFWEPRKPTFTNSTGRGWPTLAFPEDDSARHVARKSSQRSQLRQFVRIDDSRRHWQAENDDQRVVAEVLVSSAVIGSIDEFAACTSPTVASEGRGGCFAKANNRSCIEIGQSNIIQINRRIMRSRKINAAQPNTIVFVIDGESNHTTLRPDNLPLKDIAFVLEQFAIAIHAVASEDSEDHLQDPVQLSLVSISDGSVRYGIQSDRRGDRHAGRIAKAWEQRDGALLPTKARNAVEKIHGRARKLGWTRYGLDRSGSGNVRVTPSEKLFNKPLVHGGTSILAYINKVGGSTCRAEIRLPSGKRISARVKTKVLAVELGRLLYRQVELRGIATYQSKTMEMIGFEILDIGQYSENDPVEAIRKLSELDGERWGGIDVVRRVEALRHNGDSE